MRILYDSKQPQFKTPFGTLTPGQVCTLHIHIPTSVLTTKVTCVFNHEDGSWAQNAVLAFQMKKGAYDVLRGSFPSPAPACFSTILLLIPMAAASACSSRGTTPTWKPGISGS